MIDTLQSFFRYLLTVLLLLLKRFFLGWLLVDRRLSGIEDRLSNMQERRCSDCPVEIERRGKKSAGV